MYCETEWKLASRTSDSGAVQAYVRPLLGSELLADQATLVYDGFGECCMGVTVNSTFSQDILREKVKYAISRLRFISPLVAATIEAQADQHPFFRAWVYLPVQSQEALNEWAEETITVVNDPTDPSSFIRSINGRKLPYVLSGGRLQYFRLYIVRLDSGSNDFGIYLHGTHSLMDARQTIRAISHLLEWVSDPNPVPLSDLAWGTEHRNLPPGPVTATGGLRKDWEASYASLIQTINRILDISTPTTSIKSESLTVTDPTQQRRVLAKLSRSETTAVLAASKSLGLSLSHVVHAAVALALFDLAPAPSSPSEAAEAHVTFYNCLISLERFFVIPPKEVKQHLVSAFVLVPINIPWREVSTANDERSRLIEAGKIVQAQYNSYIENPSLPHLAALRHMPNQEVQPIKVPNPCAPDLTNVGNVQNDLPLSWPVDSDSPAIRVNDYHISNRITLTVPLLKTMTFDSQLQVQIEAADNWEPATLETFMQAIVRQILLIREPSH
ncbi:hypothetical protein BD414DRAFT_108247 [Trametes punicea]|nr:hypothetical protein BD414DRAFT_108247 [Trametes punicea]